MAIQGWNVLMTWRDSSLAINETYIWNGPGDDALTTIYNASKDLMKARTKMMGFGIIPVRMRLSKIGAFRVYYNADPNDIAQMQTGALAVQTNLPPAQVALNIGATQDGSADQAKAAILVDFYSADLSGHSRKFLSGVPDVLIRTDPDGPWTLGVPSWGPLFDAWANLLKGPTLKWTFNAKPSGAAITVNAYGVDLTTSLMYVELPTIPLPFTVGSYLQLRNWKMNSKAYISPNGKWQVGKIATGSGPGFSQYILRGTNAVAVTQILNAGTANLLTTGQQPFGKIQLSKQTEHKRGNRSLASPGRRTRPARVSA